MQMVRCESAVAQGLRSDKHLKCDEREQSNFHSPHSLWPSSCRPPLSTSLAPKSSQISNNWYNTKDFCYIQLSAVIHPAQCFHLQTMICMTFAPSLWDVMGAEEFASLVFQMFCQWLLSAAVSPGHSAGAAAKWLFAKSKVAWAALNGALHWWRRDTLHASVCCACITGTVTCTNCPASKVVRCHAHIKKKYSDNATANDSEDA